VLQAQAPAGFAQPREIGGTQHTRGTRVAQRHANLTG